MTNLSKAIKYMVQLKICSSCLNVALALNFSLKTVLNLHGRQKRIENLKHEKTRALKSNIQEIANTDIPHGNPTLCNPLCLHLTMFKTPQKFDALSTPSICFKLCPFATKLVFQLSAQTDVRETILNSFDASSISKIIAF